MAYSRTSITIDPAGQWLIVTALTVQGAPVVAHSDQALTTPATFPATITAATTYWLPDCTALVSPVVTQTDGTSISVDPRMAFPGSSLSFSPRPTPAQVAADTGRIYWDDLRVSLTRATTGSATPSLAVFRSPVQAYSFSKTATNELFFDVQLPHTWVAGTSLRPHLHWSPGNSTNTGTVRWELEYTWASYAEAFPVATLMDPVDQAATGVAYDHQIVALGTIAGTGKKLSSILMCRIARLGAASQDTFDAVAWALSLDFHLQVLQAPVGLEEYTGAV